MAIDDDFEGGVWGINRIRLEFKVCAETGRFGTGCVLIESDWNLKEEDRKMILPETPVLIESDWNLKDVIGRNLFRRLGVLIESEWNLKLS